MSRYLFDYDDGDYCHLILDNMAVDSDGDMLLRIGNNMAMNIELEETGKVNVLAAINQLETNEDYCKRHPVLPQGKHLRIYEDEPTRNS